MGRIVASITTSIDGYFAGPDDGPVRQSPFTTIIDYRSNGATRFLTWVLELANAQPVSDNQRARYGMDPELDLSDLEVVEEKPSQPVG